MEAELLRSNTYSYTAQSFLPFPIVFSAMVFNFIVFRSILFPSEVGCSQDPECISKALGELGVQAISVVIKWV